MNELAKEYTMLFNGITETIETLEGSIKRLRQLQQEAENTYLENCAENTLAKNKEKLIEWNLSG